MQQTYQKYGVQTTDPSAGLLNAQKDQKANLQEVLAGITNLQKNQESQIIQRNTEGLQDMLKQRIQQEGLGVLAKPIDMDAATRPFGNMIDRATATKTVEEQIGLLKNDHINRYSAEADGILAATGDPISAREHLKNQLIKAGAPSTFGDAEAVNYDLRKAAEVRNIAVREGQQTDTAIADAFATAQTGGVAAGKESLNKFISSLDKRKQAAARKVAETQFNEVTKPTAEDEAFITSTLDTFKSVTKATSDALLANIKQKNEQTSATSSSTSNSEGTSSNNKSGSGKGGKGGDDDTVTKWGKQVSNWFERLSPTHDAATLRNKYQTIFDATGDREAADKIFNDAATYAYKGDGLLGNNFSKKDFAEFDKKASELISSHEKSNGSSGRTASSSSFSKSGNISFTSSDSVTSYLADRAQKITELEAKLREAASNKRLGLVGGDVLSQITNKYFTTQPIPTTPAIPATAVTGGATTSSGKGKTTAPAKTSSTTKSGTTTTDNPFEGGTPSKSSKSKDESVEARAARLAALAKAAEEQAKTVAAASAKSPTTPAPKSNERGYRAVLKELAISKGLAKFVDQDSPEVRKLTERAAKARAEREAKKKK